MFNVYIIKSNGSGRFYVGHTKDIKQRIAAHNAGKVRSTKAYLPWIIVYSEKAKTKSDAYKRELQIKSYKSGEAFRKLITRRVG